MSHSDADGSVEQAAGSSSPSAWRRCHGPGSRAAPPGLSRPGAMRGQIKLADDFDAPLDGLFEALP